MPTTATGPLSGPVDGVRELGSLSAAFQTATGSANETEALEHIYGGATEEDLEGVTLPYMVVTEPESESMSLAVGEFGPAEVEFAIFGAITDADNREALIQFCNFAADVKAEMMAAAGNGTLYVREIRQVEMPGRTDPMREGGGQYYVARFRVLCGLEG